MNKYLALARRDPRRSYAARLAGVIVLLVLATVAAGTFLSVRVASDRLTSQTRGALQDKAVDTGQMLGVDLEGDISQLQVEGTSIHILEAVAERNATYTGGTESALAEVQALDERWIAGAADDPLVASIIDPERNETANQLVAFLDAFPDQSEVFVTDRYGATVAATGRLSDYNQADEEWWQAAWNGGNGAVYLSTPQFDESSGVTALLIAVPLIEPGTKEVIGVARSTLNVADVLRLIAGVSLGQTGRAELLDESGQVVTVVPTAGGDSPGSVLPPDALRQLALAAAGSAEVRSPDGMELIAGFAPVRSIGDSGTSGLDPTAERAVDRLPLSVIVTQEKGEALAVVDSIRRASVTAGIALTVIAALVAFLVAGQVTRPITSLVRAAEAVAGGDLQARAVVTSKDELGALASAVNRMTESLLSASRRRELEESLARFGALAQSSHDFIAITSLDRKLEYVNQGGRDLVGLEPDEDVTSLTIDDFLTEEGLRSSAEIEGPAMKAQGHWVGESTLRHRPTGRAIPVFVNSFVIRDLGTGHPASMGTIQHDITGRKRAEEALRESQAQASKIIETAHDAFVSIGADDLITGWNSQAELLFGWTREEAIGMTFRHAVIPPRYRAEHEQGMTRFLATGEGPVVNRRIEISALHRDGHEFPIELAVWAVGSGENCAFNAFIHDISYRKQAEEAMQHLAYHDSLTGLPNRALFSDRSSIAIAQAKRSGCKLAVLFLDLDYFKAVNDTVGHAAGDKLLLGAGERLVSILREADTVARMGGDEFTILLPEISEAADAIEVAERILEEFRRPWVFDGHELRVTASVGIALYPGGGEDAETLLVNADAALYRAKELGRDTFQLHVEAMNASVLERAAMGDDLRRALKLEEFVLHYQPQVDVKTGRVVGMEALVRWQHPDRGLIPPIEFIPIAEATGLIFPLGEWVMRTACAQTRAWQEAGLPSIRLAVNLSARTFRSPKLADTVAQILAETGLSPSFVQLEITESAAMDDPDLTAASLQDLQEMGIEVALDDFGTGHSSLDYLARFSIGTLKIDRSFVSGLPMDEKAAAINTAIITMAHSLNLSVIAEGVETDGQLAWLKKHNCDQFQGYLFSRALPAGEFERLLRRSQSLEASSGRRSSGDR